jgi:hypothetical protein
MYQLVLVRLRNPQLLVYTRRFILAMIWSAEKRYKFFRLFKEVLLAALPFLLMDLK